MKRLSVAVFVAVWALAFSSSSAAAGTLDACGVVTEYFVSDIPSGGKITIGGTSYAIASSASFHRTTPLPDITVGSNVCIDGTTNDTGQLLDFTATLNATPSPTPSAAPGSDPAGVGLAATALLAILVLGLLLARHRARPA